MENDHDQAYSQHHFQSYMRRADGPVKFKINRPICNFIKRDQGVH